MSDGALSQEEIDSLLAGLDGGSGSPASPSASGRQGSALSPKTRRHSRRYSNRR